jgi:hypothetical protein
MEAPIKKKRVPWNLGKKPPIKDEFGKAWCNCDHRDQSKLRPAYDDIHQAICKMCKHYWYN